MASRSATLSVPGRLASMIGQPLLRADQVSIQRLHLRELELRRSAGRDVVLQRVFRGLLLRDQCDEIGRHGALLSNLCLWAISAYVAGRSTSAEVDVRSHG